MKLAELLPASALEPGFDQIEIIGLTLDSRKVKPGWVFAALPGVAVHGSKFATQAAAAGAAAIVSDVPIEGLGIPVIQASDAPALFATMAAAYYPAQPANIVAITGTNGKSSTVEFVRQIWTAAGIDGASLGTLGVARGNSSEVTGYTTPDAAALHRSLDELARDGVTHLAMEASSHGLKQRRMEAVKVTLAAFTNLTQDHLDYHPDFEDYFASKARLFLNFMEPGAPAIINTDSEWGERMAALARERGLEVLTMGWRGEDLQICEITPRAASQDVVFRWKGDETRLNIPLVGEFQILNALAAAAITLTGGIKPAIVFDTLAQLGGVPGRLDKVGETAAGAPVLVDYAHTPYGLDKLLRAARPHTKGWVIVVFGCGGDRDPDKRAKMGAIAQKLADIAIITDDNPRSEDPDLIRAAIKSGCPDGIEIADRREAINHGVGLLREGDCLLVAGKGHETGQTIAGVVHPFDDRAVSRDALDALEVRHV